MNEGWVELPRAEVITRLESMLTVDAVSLEVESSYDPTPVGFVTSFTLILVEDNGDQAPVLLMLKDPVNYDGPGRWFINSKLVAIND